MPGRMKILWFVAVIALCSTAGLSAQEPNKLPAPEAILGEPPTAAQPESPPADKDKKTESSKKPKFDPATVSTGEAAFQRSCTKCHEASRALELTKDLAGWRTTVRRMAARRGADIATSDIEPIAVYLASRNEPAQGESAASTGSGSEAPSTTESTKESSSVSVFATLAPLYRGGTKGIQNPGFIPDAWVGGSWQGNIVSARVTACTACHGVKEDIGQLQRIELVEAVARVDFSKFLDNCCSGMKGGIEGGRFIVPFGAFSAQTNPSLYRTVSKPLIFNMGQRVLKTDLGEPVLPMPYVDEGVNLNFEVPLLEHAHGPITVTTDAYLVNGLEGNNDGLQFYQSRDLVDNNHRVAGGGRLTVGNPYVRMGTSVTGGRFNDPDTAQTFPGGLDYIIWGYDFQARYKDLLRFQAEYARRDSDRVVNAGTPGAAPFREKVSGCYVEGEARPWEHCKVSFLTRYDYMQRASLLPPIGSSLPSGSFNINRLTYGINLTLWRQSLLSFNHEIWWVPEQLGKNVNVFGVRYAITF